MNSHTMNTFSCIVPLIVHPKLKRLFSSSFRLKQDEEWETSLPVADCCWKQIVQPVMKLYTETTDGSTIEDRETALGWCYEDADPDFGSCQAKELLDHLESVLANEPVTVKSGQSIVEVKPQVQTHCHHRLIIIVSDLRSPLIY